MRTPSAARTDPEDDRHTIRSRLAERCVTGAISGRRGGELRSTLHRARYADVRDCTCMLRVAILDDHPAVLAGLRRLIDAQADMTVIAAAPTVGKLSQQLDGDHADIAGGEAA